MRDEDDEHRLDRTELDAGADAASGRAPDPDPQNRGAPARRRSRWTYPVLVACLLLAGAGAWYWYRMSAPGHAAVGQKGGPSADAKAPADKGVPVEVAKVKLADLPIFYDSLGTVQAFNSVTVRSRIDGEVETIAFKEGQGVKEGDLLAQIDARPYQAALDQALAKKKQDEATLVSNNRDLARTQKLAGSGYAPQQQLDQQLAQVGALTAQLAADQAAIEAAQTQLGYTTIRAPISGRTGIRLVDQGNIVHASDQTGIVDIAQIHPISVLFTAPEQQLQAVQAARQSGPVEITALSADGKTVLGQGKLELINNQVDAASGTVRLKATFDNADDRLWPGLSVNTRLLVTTLKGAVAIPDDAILRGQDEMYAYVVGPDGKAEKRTIKVGPFTQGQAVIEGGLSAGETVVTAGQYRVEPGIRLDVGEPKPLATTSGPNGLTASPTSSTKAP